MPEAGGTTTQSGIYYQNSIAALYLGRLLDPRPRTAGERVIEVRVEAPVHVDDIVVRHADGSCSYIQAKESLSIPSAEWNKLWSHFAAQANECKDEHFHLILAIGSISKDIDQLQELCDRAKGKRNYEEWIDSLSVALKSLTNKIVDALPEKSLEATYELIKFIEVWIWPLKNIESSMIPIWIPTSSLTVDTLFDLLRGKIGGKARVRGLFHTAQLLDELYNENKVKILDVPAWGADAYLRAIRAEMGTLTVPGTKLRGPINELFFWMPLHDRANDNIHLDFEDEDPRRRWDSQKEKIDLRNFPLGKIKCAVIDAGAGFGKTTMLHAIAYRLSFGVYIPALISLDALAASGMTVLGYLSDKINTEYDVSIDWERLCEGGRAVVLFDGLDELSTADRTTVLNIIKKFSARFPESAFLLTVRDSSALTLPLGLPVLALNRLDDDAIRKFTEAYARHGGNLSADELTNHLIHHPDLGHLLRIPLFLALVLASVGPKENLPRSRSDVLEHYLSLLFSPERYKAMAFPLQTLSDIREVTELLAWHGLENDSIGFSENEVRRILRGQELGEKPDTYIERLLQIGVLLRTAARLRFTYPIIQEYLAACWIVENITSEIEPRFANVNRRPWAQTLQFALEMHPDAEKIITNQLKAPDDAFNTKLRLIARCIVNGAKIGIELRNKIGDLLAAAWPSETYRISESIGYLIADGFIDPLPLKAVEHISKWALSYGGAEIVATKMSPTLTRDILIKQISKDLTHRGYLHGWQIAVDEIAEEALNIYLKRVRNKETTAKEIDSLASLIATLPPTRLKSDQWAEIATDSSLPLAIRLAGYRLGPRPISENAWPILEDVISLSEIDEKDFSAFLAYRTFWELKGSEDKFMKMLVDISAPLERIRYILDELIKHKIEVEDKQAILRRLFSAPSVPECIQFLMLLCFAVWGDEQAEQETIQMLPNQNVDNITVWLYQANKFSEKAVHDAIKNLTSLSFNSEQLIQLVVAADFGLSYKTEMTVIDVGVAIESFIHPARADMLKYLCVNLKNDESIDALIARLRTGDTSVCGKLISEIKRLLSCTQGFMIYNDDQKVNIALYSLKQNSIVLPIDLIFEIIEKSSSNAGNHAVDWLVRYGDEKVVLKLLECYNAREKDFVSEGIFKGLETLASRYGMCIIRNGAKLVIE